MRSPIPALLLAASLAHTTAARADCYDVFGCTDRNAFQLNDLLNGPNCDFLYEMRNRIYAQHGYCFSTARAIASLGNQGCLTSNVSQLGLNAVEQQNALTIRRAEQTKRCPD